MQECLFDRVATYILDRLRGFLISRAMICLTKIGRYNKISEGFFCSNCKIPFVFENETCERMAQIVLLHVLTVLYH